MAEDVGSGQSGASGEIPASEECSLAGNGATTTHELVANEPSLITHRPSLRLMIVAGEASGDKHGASLARALTGLNAETRLEMFGAGGDEMRKAGVETLVDAREVAIIGVPEIARALGKLYRSYRTLLAAARARRPEAVVLIDWPDFNLRLAKKLHREGFKVIYYVSPQVWAWRKYRVRAIRRDVDRMLVILPFEVEFYRRAGIEAEFVGHPLAEAVRITAPRDEFARRNGLDPTRPMIALLPGSRRKEIHYHLPPMIDAAARLPRYQFVIPLASTVDRHQVDVILNRARVPQGVEVAIIAGDTYNALGHAEFAVVASGTATVEAALIGTPMVIVYRASELNWLLIRPLIHLNTFGMVNLIAGRRIVPELIQHDVTGERIVAAVSAILSDSNRLAQIRDALAMVREKLTVGAGYEPQRAARAIIETIGAQGQSRATRGRETT
ncbi:MAG TPA: lipid-A-disaccharide synthase [Blastocatellia bacterium]|nr:lipid-A-disaccharide synthase [Blastocatellia bacterium]